jgi:hypothetical protein
VHHLRILDSTDKHLPPPPYTGSPAAGIRIPADPERARARDPIALGSTKRTPEAHDKKEFSNCWVNFQILQRTHSTLSDELGVEPQVRADQMGHTVDVNQNRYTKVSHSRRLQAVTMLEEALGLTSTNGIRVE